MAHQQQRDFIKKTKDHFPECFEGEHLNVLEVGSLNINGTVRDFFKAEQYLGLDLMEGRDVDFVCAGHEYAANDGTFDTTISTECFEHDKHWKETFANMYRMTKPGGMVLFTCASEGRHEHGTTRTTPADSPATTDYYENRVAKDFEDAFDLAQMFKQWLFEYNPVTCNLVS